MPLNSTRGAASAKGFGFTAEKARTAAFTADLLMVAGGGGGATDPSSGGGGAGGMILYPAYPFGSGPQSYPIVIGGGGTAGAFIPGTAIGSQGGQGGDTEFYIGPVTFTAKGGGRAGNPTMGPGITPSPGGSGGGGMGESGPNTAGTSIQAPSMPAPFAPFGFGNSGGTGTSGPRAGAGGGGAGAGGAPSSGGPGGQGGAGKDTSPLFGAAPQPYYGPPGSPSFFGGGGGGTTEQVGPADRRLGGTGGGGNGGSPDVNAPDADHTGENGATNFGGGGGAGQRGNQTGGPAGAGGSGVVLIKVPSTAAPRVSATPGTNTVTSTPTGAVVRFTVNGNFVY